MPRKALTLTDEEYRQIFDDLHNQTVFVKAPLPIRREFVKRASTRINQYCLFCGICPIIPLSAHMRAQSCPASTYPDEAKEMARLFSNEYEVELLKANLTNPLDLDELTRKAALLPPLDLVDWVIDELRERLLPMKGSYTRPSTAHFDSPVGSDNDDDDDEEDEKESDPEEEIQEDPMEDEEQEEETPGNPGSASDTHCACCTYKNQATDSNEEPPNQPSDEPMHDLPPEDFVAHHSLGDFAMDQSIDLLGRMTDEEIYGTIRSDSDDETFIITDALSQSHPLNQGHLESQLGTSPYSQDLFDSQELTTSLEIESATALRRDPEVNQRQESEGTEQGTVVLTPEWMQLFSNTADSGYTELIIVQKYDLATYGELQVFRKRLDRTKQPLILEFEEDLRLEKAAKTTRMYGTQICRFMLPILRAKDKIDQSMTPADFVSSSAILLNYFAILDKKNVSIHVRKQMIQSLMCFVRFLCIRRPPDSPEATPRILLQYLMDLLLKINRRQGLQIESHYHYQPMNTNNEISYSVAVSILENETVMAKIRQIKDDFWLTKVMKPTDFAYISGHVMEMILKFNALRDEGLYKIKYYDVFPLADRVIEDKQTIRGQEETIRTVFYEKPKQYRKQNKALGFIVLSGELWNLFEDFAKIRKELFPNVKKDSTFFVCTRKGTNMSPSSVDDILKRFYVCSGFSNIDTTCTNARRVLHTTEYRQAYQDGLDRAASEGTATISGHGVRTQVYYYVKATERRFSAIQGHLKLRKIREHLAEKDKKQIQEAMLQVNIRIKRKARAQPPRELIPRKRKAEEVNNVPEKKKRGAEPTPVPKLVPGPSSCPAEKSERPTKMQSETSDVVREEEQIEGVQLDQNISTSQRHRIEDDENYEDDAEIRVVWTSNNNHSEARIFIKIEEPSQSTSVKTALDFAENEEYYRENENSLPFTQMPELDPLDSTQPFEDEDELEVEATQSSTRSIIRPVQPRRSGRCRLSAKEKEECAKQDLRLILDSGVTENNLVEFQHPDKGRCIRAGKNFQINELVAEYRGKLLTHSAAVDKELEYSHDSSIGSYMYFFTFANQKWCIDATKDEGQKGRLISHSYLSPNLKTKAVMLDQEPRLLFMAKKTIKKNDELTFNYGDTDPGTVKIMPWLKKS